MQIPRCTLPQTDKVIGLLSVVGLRLASIRMKDWSHDRKLCASEFGYSMLASIQGHSCSFVPFFVLQNIRISITDKLVDLSNLF